jgi:hypothetical protein
MNADVTQMNADQFGEGSVRAGTVPAQDAGHPHGLDPRSSA